MAIYHLHISTGNKAAGKSGGTRYDYITRQQEYAKKANELVHQESGNMPSWASSPKHFWTAADTFERANGRVYKEVEFALPRELTHEKQEELARDFARELTGKEDLPYTLAIHDKNGKNPHAHLVYSERGFDGYERTPETHFKRANSKNPERGGAPKVQDMGGKEWVKGVGKEWEVLANAALERTQTPARIDARSYEEQGINRTPQVHLGVHANAMEKRGITTDRGDIYRERQDMRRLEHNLVQLDHNKQLAQRELQRQVEAEAQRKQEEHRRVQAELAAHTKRREGWRKVESRVQHHRDSGGVLSRLPNGHRVVGEVLGEMRSSKDKTQVLHVMTNAHDPKVLVGFSPSQRVHEHGSWQVGKTVCIDATGPKMKFTQDLRSPLQKYVDEHPKVVTVKHREFSGHVLDGGSYRFPNVPEIRLTVFRDNEDPSRLLLARETEGDTRWAPNQSIRVRLNENLEVVSAKPETRSPQEIQEQYQQGLAERARVRQEQQMVKDAPLTLKQCCEKLKKELYPRDVRALRPGASVKGELMYKDVATKDGVYSMVQTR